MHKLLLSGLACAGLMLALPDTASAHGGQYRGPGDVVPPNPGGGGGRTPGPSGPSTPGPGGPATPGPAGPSTPGPAGPGTGGPAGPAGGGGPTTGQGMQLEPDLNTWQFWWEFNKDPFINLKEAVHDTGVVTAGDDFYMGAGRQRVSKDTLKPNEEQILGQILPALKRALDSTDQRDIISSCLVAMAKIGKDTEQIKILEEFAPRLKESNQEIRETAALAFGLSQMPEGIETLVELVKDSPKGRELCGRSEVDDRTRTFAAYGLGLISWATSNVDLKRQAFEAIKPILEDDTISDRNIRVGAINALALLKPGSADTKSKELFKDICTALRAYWDKDLGPGEQMIQAHVPPAIAKLFDSVDQEDPEIAALSETYKELWTNELTGKTKKKANEVVQSAIVALGRMAKPAADKKDRSLDARISDLLLEYFRKGKNEQARYFALMALAQIGGEQNRLALMTALSKGQKALEKPWAAVSLGVLCYKAMEAAGDRATVDTAIGTLLRSEFNDAKNPELLSAIAVGLGLTKYKEAADDIRASLEKNKSQDELAGYLCIGLALMNDQHSLEIIRDLVETSVRRPERLQQAAIALGKLGDKSAAEVLVKMMTEGEPNLAKMAAIASALGFIGDRRTIDPLIKMLFDEGLTDLSRAFAAVALGGIADKELLPWNSKIGTNMNYRAAVETLTNQQNGILDIL